MGLQNPKLTSRLTREQAAARARSSGLRCTSATLANHASRGTGPAFRIIQGRAFYLEDDVDQWTESQIGQLVRRAADARHSEPVRAA